jgi:acyl carrier protein
VDKAEILKTVNAIFIDVLDNEKVVLTDQTTANQVAEWDSLTHIQLVVAIEKRFGIRFTSGEIQRWKNVGELVDTIAQKLTGKK